jgi:tRNA-specific 2-thiouridylase
MGSILVAMSGGVDSSVAAALLVEAGHEVVGATLRTFCYTAGPSHAKSCCGLEGVEDARSVARTLGIPHSVFDVEEEFTRDVIEDFISEYTHGRTPNPCVRCNSFTKFGDLLRLARDMGADGVATGHYVRIDHDSAPFPSILRGKDEEKDQAYFLWGLPREALPSLRFPLGDLTKEQVRELARARDLVTADKPESQEICFVPTGDYRDLLRSRLDSAHPAFMPGPIVTLEGQTVGEHQGYAGFTVGQRKGLPGGFSEAMFVVEIRARTREVVVGPRERMWAREAELDQMNWMGEAPRVGEDLEVQLRHRAKPTRAQVRASGHGQLTLRLAEPQFAVTPGQSGVLFHGDRLLGGGRIIRSGRTPTRNPPR